jgi:hypothetical protein
MRASHGIDPSLDLRFRVRRFQPLRTRARRRPQDNPAASVPRNAVFSNVLFGDHENVFSQG